MCKTPRRAHHAAQMRRQLISACAWAASTPPSCTLTAVTTVTLRMASHAAVLQEAASRRTSTIASRLPECQHAS